jgi:D-threo-aldose 1-dehydrogenase
LELPTGEALRIAMKKFLTASAVLAVIASPDVAAALIVGAHTEAQNLANVSSMQATIPPEFWAELKRQNLIEQNALTPTVT